MNPFESTNPFDSDYESNDDGGDGNNARNAGGNGDERPRRRSAAPLNFNTEATPEKPALRFDASPTNKNTTAANKNNHKGSSFFPSPLAHALLPSHHLPVLDRYDSEMDSSLESEDEHYKEYAAAPMETSLLLATKTTSTSTTPRVVEGIHTWIPKSNTSLMSNSYKNTTSKKSSTAPIIKRKNSGMLSLDNASGASLRSRRSSTQTTRKSRVLKALTTTTRHDDHHEFKTIRLEDLGTAKSWLILFLPYMAFAVCVLLESNTRLKIHTLGPLVSQQECFKGGKDTKTYSVPIVPAPPDPCTYWYELDHNNNQEEEELAPPIRMVEAQHLHPMLQSIPIHAHNNITTITNNNNNNKASSSWGAAFDSGIITSVPPEATFLTADASFFHLTLESLAAIQRGSIWVSGLLFQRKRQVDEKGLYYDEDWSLVATSRSEPLSMACYYINVGGDYDDDDNGSNTNSSSSSKMSNQQSWACHSPRIMEILFSMPGSAILSGEELRINILFSFPESSTTKDSNTFDADDLLLSSNFLYADKELQTIIQNAEIPHTDKEQEAIVLDIIQSSEFTLRHTNPTSIRVDVWGRVIALIVTVSFALYWFYKLGCHGCCSGCCFGGCCCCRKNKDSKDNDEIFQIKRAMALLDSPWVQSPERWYIAVLFFAVICIQGPLVVVMYFTAELNTNPHVKTASDTLVGVGVNAVLFVYLCLFEGFQFHTASAARKWVDHHRKLHEIQRVTKYMADNKDDEEEYKRKEDTILSSFFGDPSSLSQLRLSHDPMSEYSADFLVPKLVLFFLGAVSIWLTAFTRFHFTSDETKDVSTEALEIANLVYLVGYLLQFATLLTWMILILRSSIITGHKLRVQPFLSTRPAQLAYRVLFAHVTLGFLSLAVMVFVGFHNLIRNWNGGDTEFTVIDQDPVTSLNFWLQLLTRLTQRFPYSGTASSIGFGRIFFATVSILIASFIFLPPKHDESLSLDEAQENDDNPGPENKLAQRRDKRAVVSMMKNAHTWRVFPIPIERATVIDQMLMPRSLFQLYSNGQRDYNNTTDSAVVSVGPYTPVFCIELAAWLLEACFQSYYSPTAAVEWKDETSGEMNLKSIGLRLEAAILDQETNTQAFVATNIADQVDAGEDQCIVIAFRGSVDATNARTDLKYSMVPLLDQIIGIGRPPFRVSAAGVTIDDNDGWVWSSPLPEVSHSVSCFSTSNMETQCLPFGSNPRKKKAPFSAVSKSAIAVLSATPVARNTLPCVHDGFSEVYAVLRRKVIESVLPVLKRQLVKAIQRNEGLGENVPLNLPKIYITGHSLGGSLAQLLALDLASNCELFVEGGSCGANLKPEAEVFQLPTPTGSAKPTATETKQPKNERVSLQPPICCYTYGQPRVGNRAFSRLYKQRVPHTFRVATEGDPFTMMPTMLLCAGIYKHAGLEVVLDETKTGNLLVGPTVVETLFRFHKVRTNVAAHSTNRYRDCLESALEPHELQEYYRGHMGAASAMEEGYGSTGTQNQQDVPEWMTQGRSTGR